MDFSEEVLINVMEKLITHTREMYIKGYILLKEEYGYIPSYEKFMAADHKNLSYKSRLEHMAGYYEAREFFIDDPYSISLKVSGEYICQELDKLAEKRMKELKEEGKKNVKRKNA